MLKTSLRLIPVIALAAGSVLAEVKLASPFASHMVLQSDMKVPVWGKADAGEKVTVEFSGQHKSTKAGADGTWSLSLDPLAVSTESRIFTVTGSATPQAIALEDVLVGEVWLCGGQSNMERQLGLRGGQKPIVDWEKEVAEANYPLIRQLYVTQSLALTPQATVKATWTVCSPSTVADFTAVGYFFARDLHKARNVPIGIIHSSWGGTPAEAWTSTEGLGAFPEFADALASVKATAIDPVAAKNAFVENLARWFHDNDKGNGEQPWSAPSLDTAGWDTMQLPVKWEDAGLPNFDGVVWFRKSFDLPDGWKGGDIELRLSSIDDSDVTWVNGTPVGEMTDSYATPRIYRVPGSALKQKGNSIAVRVLDTGGGGGIWNKDLPFEIAAIDASFAPIPLAGPWQYRISADFSQTKRPPMQVSNSPGTPTVLFNAMIAPLVPYAMRGVIFYQGEANADRPAQYRKLLPALISDWRHLWNEGSFPFLYVQIAPYKDQPPEIREAQLLAFKETKNTAMAVTVDCGDAEDIHPNHKQPVGARLALAARALAYGEKIEFSGPIFEKMKTKANSAILHFSHRGEGLVSNNGPLTGFTVAGKDMVFHPAQAEIAGDTVVVTASQVDHPVAVRYAWANVAAGNLFSRAGLPASPFRTDAPDAK